MSLRVRSLFFAIIFILPLSGMLNGETGWIGSYNSQSAGLEDSQEARVYTTFQLSRLRRAVTPRYVRILDEDLLAAGTNPMQRGILFTCEGYRSREVFLSGDFNNWGRLRMNRNSMGVYYVVLPVREIESGRRIYRYHYKFVVDGIWKHDPMNKNYVDDGLGGVISEFNLDREDINRLATVRVLSEGRRMNERLVEFAIYLPDVENLSLVGNFNDWNPEHDLLVKGQDGIFRLRLRLRPGEYVYKYIADGRWVLDPYNPETRFHETLDELCSYIKLD